MQFDIYADSAANIPQDLARQRKINIIPFTFIINGEEYSCVDESVPFPERAKAYYAAMRSGIDVKTSLLGQARFEEAILPSLEAGRDVFLITMASGISGTYTQAVKARDALLSRFPDRKIVVGDSANASLGEGLLALRVADLRDLGEGIEACEAWFKHNRYKLNSAVTVGDLKYLRKGGRISAAVAIAGTLLGIKAMLKADGGANAKLVFAGKEKGRKKALSALLRAVDANSDGIEGQTVAITHADCEEEALALKEELLARGAGEVILEYYDLCTGSHVGPDTIALFFWGKDRRGNVPDAPKSVPVGGRVPAKAKI